MNAPASQDHALWSYLRQNAVSLAVGFEPAPVDDGRGVGSGWQFKTRIQWKKPWHLIFQNDPVLQEDHLLKVQELLV